MPDFLFYVSCAANAMMVILIWALSYRVVDLKGQIDQLNEVIGNKQARYYSLRERYNKLSEMKDSEEKNKLASARKNMDNYILSLFSDDVDK